MSKQVVARMTVGVIAFCGDCGKMLRKGQPVVQVRVDAILDTRCEQCAKEMES